MSWRTVVISSRCKLDFRMGYMVVRNDEIKRIFLDEIAVLLIENPAVSLTGCLLNALVEKKIRVIFCDYRHSPLAEIEPYYGSFDSSRKLKMQLSWKEETIRMTWTLIVEEKIRQQALFLQETKHCDESELLFSYIKQLEEYDESNREGHAAKVYFNALFGKDYSRNDSSFISAALDYGYSILLSAFNREISACGYLTQIGLFHDNIFNHFNLSCDLMEPFRVLIDKVVYSMNPSSFDKNEKTQLIDALNHTIIIDNTRQTVLNAIRIYCRSIFDALSTDNTSEIKFYSNNEL